MDQENNPESEEENNPEPEEKSELNNPEDQEIPNQVSGNNVGGNINIDGNITPVQIEDEMKRSYLDYSMSVIVSRALPDVRDGLKPVHRRILFGMHGLGLLHNKPYKKSARIVGEVLGKYHPHGDAAVYDSMVRMAQPFSLRYMLVQGQGNFGSVDGDTAAAMRYTEARLDPLAEEMLADLEKETVDMVPNFDGSLKEPSVLPSKLPNLLVNGSSGIAVGMATNIPPHNISEVCEGIIRTIDNPKITNDELIEVIKGPDFPTGGIICGHTGIILGYKQGRGKIIVRAKTEIEDKKNHQNIIITQVPYMVNKAESLEQMASLVRDKVIEGISDIRDESDREGMRVVIELKQNANPDVVLNQIFKHTRMQVTFGVNMLALVNGVPHMLTLRDMIRHFIGHRQDVVRRRTAYELRKAQERCHILEGLIIALNNIDEVIRKIKASADYKAAVDILVKDYSLSDVQAKAILDMKLQRLASLEQEKIRKEYDAILVMIKELREILESEKKILDIIKEETAEILKKYGDGRRTLVIDGEADSADIEVEDLIKKEDMIVTITHTGYIKRLAVDTYKAQKRGGRGVVAAGMKEEDFVENLFVANTHSYILMFTNRGQVFWKKVYQIPSASRQAKGTAIVNLLPLAKDEKVTAFVPVDDFSKGFFMMCTKNGIIKKCEKDLFSRPRSGGIRAIVLDEGDELINVLDVNKDDKVIIGTRNGQAIRFDESDIRPVGRAARGVLGTRLREGDFVVGVVLANDDLSIMTVTENGYGKRTDANEYRIINRGGVGVISIQCSERNGGVVGVRAVQAEDEVVLISKDGIAIRMGVVDIPNIGRNTQGVRLMRLEEGDRVSAIAKIAKESVSDENEAEPTSDGALALSEDELPLDISGDVPGAKDEAEDKEELPLDDMPEDAPDDSRDEDSE